MNYFKEIRNKINQFCNDTPAQGFEINYLEEAKKLLNLYGEACVILENEEDEIKLKEIYEKVNNIV